MKYIERITATAKVLWRERADIAETIGDRVKRSGTKAQRYLLVSLVFILCMVVAARVATETQPPKRTDLATVSPEAAIVAEQEQAEAARAMEVAAEEQRHREEAVAVARALYGIRGYELSDTAKKAVVDVIMARAECSYTFPDTIPEVVYAPAQFQGEPSETSEYLESDAELAERYISARRSGGGRTVPEGCYWFVCSWHSVTVRTAWDGGNSWEVS